MKAKFELTQDRRLLRIGMHIFGKAMAAEVRNTPGLSA